MEVAIHNRGGGAESVGNEQEPKPCCAPNAQRTDHTAQAALISFPSTSPSHAGMTTLTGGTFIMGTDYAHGFPNDGEGPVRPVVIEPFRIDTTPVTNAQFAAFIAATNYRTEAERFGWSFVFWAQIPEDRFESVVADTAASTPWWCKVPGAWWIAPEGPGSDIAGRENHPVVHVTWNDAAAYAAWAGKSLPTEAQWEFAARGGLEQKLYPWGDDLTPDGRHLCNIWQGRFPVDNTEEDGYQATSPVAAYPPNGFGLLSMTGNTWEWCADAFSADHTQPPPSNPEAPRVMKGGSYLCHASYCNRYRVAARTSNTPDSSASNIGFRCVTPL